MLEKKHEFSHLFMFFFIFSITVADSNEDDERIIVSVKKCLNKIE